MEQMKSEREELKEKLNADFNIDNLKRVLEYCKSNIDSMDKNDETDKDLLDYSAGYLMQYKLGSLDKGEAVFLAKYYAMYCIGLYEKNGLLMQDVKMEVLNQEEFEKKSGKGTWATCTDQKDGTQIFSYSEKLIEMIMRNKPMDVLMAFQAIGHEVVHGVQNSMIRNGEVDGIDISNIELAYLMALEELTRRGFPEFYSENYDNLITENNAEANGLRLATGFLKAWAPQAFGTIDEEKVQEVFDKYRENSENRERIVLGKKIKKENVHMVMENAARVMLRKNPKLLQDYPILKVAYNEEGIRKCVTRLLDERETRIKKDESIAEKANSLFLTILDSRYMTEDEINSQIDEIESYTWHRESDFGFVCDILRNRFERLGLSKEEIEKRIGGLEVVEHEDEKSQSEEQQESSRSKQEEQMTGVEQEASEVNLDEVGYDENTVQVSEGQAQTSQETQWMETMKRISDEATEIEGYSKKQEEIIQAVAMTEIQKEGQKTGSNNIGDTEK